MKRIATLDIETDPFLYGRVPLPFACGFYDGETYHQTWGDNCIAEMVNYLEYHKEPCEIFAHNGGKFDWYYFAYALDGPINFIKNRMLRAQLAHHTVRDSYAIIPAPLRDYKKDVTDYTTFETESRERYRDSISLYLRHDCEYLHTLVSNFIETFGNKLTIASTSLKELRKLHTIDHQTENFDAQFRPYYFGGRVQCFQRGIIKGDWKCFDINSSYPNVMRNFAHPNGRVRECLSLPDHGVYFAKIIADSVGALPLRDRNGLQFPVIENQEFQACSHEIQAGLETGTLRIKKVIECFAFSDTQNFASFVDKFFNAKIAAELSGDAVNRLFYKLLLNNAYGKFAQNPAGFRDYTLEPEKNVDLSRPWKPSGMFGVRELYERPANITASNYWNVAIGASITSAARAYLFRALHRAINPMYCDTDSIICEALDAPLDATQLGAWKLEARADTLALVGKKMYAAFARNKCVKQASKGVPLTPETIRNIARSRKPYHANIAAPSYRIGRKPKFIDRTIRIT